MLRAIALVKVFSLNVPKSEMFTRGKLHDLRVCVEFYLQDMSVKHGKYTRKIVNQLQVANSCL